MLNKKFNIQVESDTKLYEKIPVNFIYNRFDLQGDDPKGTILLCIRNTETMYIPVRISGSVAWLGIELTRISAKIIRHIVKFLFSNYPDIKEVRYKNGMTAMGEWVDHNYFVLDIPKNLEELQKRQAADSRRKLRKRTHLVERELGEIVFEEYSREQLPKDVVSRFFEFKNITHNRDYHLAGDEYLSKYYVTHIYVLKINECVEAIRLDCEQCEGVYAENHTYNPQLAKYRLGQLLYHYFLNRLVEKGKKTLYLSGGDYDYKRHYGSQELQVYDCVIYRSGIKRGATFAKRQLRRIKRLLINKIGS